MDEYSKLLYLLAGVAITGFVGWTSKCIIDLRIEIRELRTKTGDIAEMKGDIKILTSLVYEIAGKLGVPIRRD